MLEGLHALLWGIGPVPVILAGYALLGSLFLILLKLPKAGRRWSGLRRAFGILAIGGFLCIFNFMMIAMMNPERYPEFLFGVELVGLVALMVGTGLVSLWGVKDHVALTPRIAGFVVYVGFLVLYSAIVALLAMETAWGYMA